MEILQLNQNLNVEGVLFDGDNFDEIVSVVNDVEPNAKVELKSNYIEIVIPEKYSVNLGINHYIVVKDGVLSAFHASIINLLFK